VSSHVRSKIFQRLTIEDLKSRNKTWSTVLLELQERRAIDDPTVVTRCESDDRESQATLERVECLTYFREVLAERVVVDYARYAPGLRLFFQHVEYFMYTRTLPELPLRDPYNFPEVIEPRTVTAIRHWLTMFRVAVLPQLCENSLYRLGFRVAEKLVSASNNDGIRLEHVEARYGKESPEFHLRIDPEKNPPVLKALKQVRLIPSDPNTDYLNLGVSSVIGKISLGGKERNFKVEMVPKASSVVEPVICYQNMKNLDTGLALKLKFVEVASRKPKNSFGRVSEMTRVYKRFRYFLGHLGQYYVRRCLPAFAHDVNHRQHTMQLEVANPFKANHEVAYWEGTRTSNLGYDGYEENVLIEEDLLGEMLREHASTNSFSTDLQSRLLYSGRKWLGEHTNVPATEVTLLNNTVRYAYLQLQINRAALNEVLVTTVNSVSS